jgi:hypothetical protein
MSPTNRGKDSGEFWLEPDVDRRNPPAQTEGPDATPSEEDFAALCQALGAAAHPRDLSEDEHLALLEGVLGMELRAEPSSNEVRATPGAPSELAPVENVVTPLVRLHDEPTSHPLEPQLDASLADAEQLDARRLARALDGLERHPLAELAFELREAHRPEPLSSIAAERALTALDSTDSNPRRVLPLTRKEDGRPPIRGAWIWATGTAIAMAAGWAVMWRSLSPVAPRAPASPQPLALSRSAEPLLETAQYWQGGTTERIDRIAVVRSRELRRNRYLNWRVR